jgi:hypothetical protein
LISRLLAVEISGQDAAACNVVDLVLRLCGLRPVSCQRFQPGLNNLPGLKKTRPFAARSMLKYSAAHRPARKIFSMDKPAGCGHNSARNFFA